MLNMENLITWKAPKAPKSKKNYDIRLSLINTKDNKAPRLAVTFGHTAPIDEKYKRVRVSTLHANATIIWFLFVEDENDSSGYKLSERGGVKTIQPTLDEDEVKTFHNRWEKNLHYELHHDADNEALYYITAND